MLLDFIGSDKGKMLSDTLREFRETDTNRLENLIRGISRIMISLASKAQPRIGSLWFNDDGSTTLANRPLLCANFVLESEGAPKFVDKKYATIGTFFDDMLRFRKEAFRAQPNAVNDEEDCHLQMYQMTLLRRMKSHFVDHHYQGPFVLQLTDFHASNVFVDDEWNIVALIDLEFVCALPPDMLDVPHWLLVDSIDEVSGRLDEFSKIHELFMRLLREEEENLNHENDLSLASSMEQCWATSSCWFYGCFTSINGMQYYLEDHLFKKFGLEPSINEENHYAKMISSRWSPDSNAVVKQKLRDKSKYNDDLAKHFEGHQPRLISIKR